jgi:hypothetical protein
MPLLEIYKDNEVSASAVESDSGVWTPQVTVTGMTVKMKVTVPNINKTFPTREEAEEAGLLFGKQWIDQGSQRLNSKEYVSKSTEYQLK